MTVDIEQLTATFLRAQPVVVAIADDRVYTDLPHHPAYPLVLVNRIGGGSIYKNHLENAEVEINAYGGTHKVAYNLANVCLSTMAATMVGAHTEGVVTRVKVSAIAYSPEPDSADPQGHARPRYVVSAVVTAHP